MDNKLYKLMNWPEIESVIYSECDHPFDILGKHEVQGGFLIQAFFPGANAVYIHNLSLDKDILCEKVDEEGFFACYIPSKTDFSYTYKVDYNESKISEYPEVYSYKPMFWLNLEDKLKAGVFYDSYRYLGAHFGERKGILGTEFMVFAPNAARVSVVGDFNNWDGRLYQMERLNDIGVFGIFLPGITPGNLYKFEIKLRNGLTFLKRDPYAFSFEKGTGDASRVIEDHEWEIIKYKRCTISNDATLLNISLEAFSKNYGDYKETATALISLANELGFDGILFNDFGFCANKEVTDFGKLSFFSVCPDVFRIKDLKLMMDMLHASGLKVMSVIDLSGFLPDNGGLKGFDGTNIFERDEVISKNLLTFNLESLYTRNYLISACDYFVKVLSLDGIAIGGIDRLLYLDYDREDNSWSPNIYGGNESLGGVELIKHLNSILHKRYTNLCTIALNSYASYNLTKSLDEDGLGFDAKICSYFDEDLIAFANMGESEKKESFGKLTNTTVNMFCERFYVSFLNKDYGFKDDSLVYNCDDNVLIKKRIRMLISYLYMYPGRKCISFSEFSDSRHKVMVKELNSLYKNFCFEGLNDDSVDSFKWINAVDSESLVIAFERIADNGRYLIISNFSLEDKKYNLLDVEGEYRQIFCSDASEYGGNTFITEKVEISKPLKASSKHSALTVSIPAETLLVYEKMP